MSPAVAHLTALGRTLLTCNEYAEIEVAPELVLRSDGTLRVSDDVLNRYVMADFKNGKLRFLARGVSGIFALTDEISVQVRPRFPLTNLTHMVTVCGYVPTALAALRPYHVTDRWDDWMLDVVTDALLVAVDTIEERGLLRVYHRQTDSSSYPHGRIEIAPTITQFASRGIDHRAVYSWFEKTADNPANRCLKSAALFLHSRYLSRQLTGEVRQRISRLSNALRVLYEAADDRHHTFMADAIVRASAALPESRTYYRPALDLAVAVLSGRGLDLDAETGSISAGSLLVKTEDLFESFVRLSLQRVLTDHPELRVLDGNVSPGKQPLFEAVPDEEKESLPEHSEVGKGTDPNATPDILFTQRGGGVPLVADVKYTNVTRYAARSELEQVMVYGVRYGSPIVLTIHPRRKYAAGGLVICGRIGDVLVAQYRVDLAADDLDVEMAAMAQSLVELIASAS
ncbi:5-methylcytosine restriction system specificity protein McrC [Nocardia goodfellowii]